MKGKFRKAVFIVVYKKEKGKTVYLILKRKKHWTGWEFPKGGVDKGESLLQAVKRETKEESGAIPLKIKKYGLAGRYFYDKIFSDRPGIIGQSYTLFSAEVKQEKTKIDKKEHSDFVWLPFNKAIKKLTYNNQKKSLRIVNLSLNR